MSRTSSPARPIYPALTPRLALLGLLILFALLAGAPAQAHTNPIPAMAATAWPTLPLAPRAPHDVSVQGDARSDD